MMEKNNDFRVSGCQMPVTRNVQENVRRILNAVDQAAEAFAEILSTPEGSLSGYTHHFDAAEVRGALKAVKERARLKEVGLPFGTWWQPGGVFEGRTVLRVDPENTLWCRSMTSRRFVVGSTA